MSSEVPADGPGTQPGQRPQAPERERDFSAGGVVLRGEQVAVIVPFKRGPNGERVLGLPKGHPDKDETPEQAAVREVREETGLEVELIAPLGEISYSHQRAGRTVDKTVAFYLMRYLSGSLDDHDHEIEEARWMEIHQAAQELTFAGEREIVRLALSRRATDL
jgi:8-oxo-dGTP pyrophosphatase MutT (NUDIX family)